MVVGISSSTIMAEKISCYCALLMAMMLVLSCCEVSESELRLITVNQNGIVKKPCDEIYVVREGETLHTISEKCGDPYIVEENPHIHDPDDVFPGLVIKITPFKNRCHCDPLLIPTVCNYITSHYTLLN
ncbi:uncharacterized protein LOC112536362 isoform X2 [Ricinus communis]|uniref:uncharacterized protein LOC112536362 isoform X2 n=1 Tax=Ricinus communis TaxID=3988 RepID=UPI00201B1C54|nr:uncharacterized protein LOC112536362 isoform X2 [Ricinus communis]